MSLYGNKYAAEDREKDYSPTPNFSSSVGIHIISINKKKMIFNSPGNQAPFRRCRGRMLKMKG